MPVYKLSAYPKEFALKDGRRLTIRPMERSDSDALLEFFLRVPASDRFFLKEDVTSPKVIEGWVERLDYNRALPLLALSNGRIVADAALIRSRSGAYRAIGRVRIVVEPEFRNQGLGTMLLRELCDIAVELELELLLAEFVVDVEDDAIAAVDLLGFVRASTVHAVVRDERGHPHDLVTMVCPLGNWRVVSQF